MSKNTNLEVRLHRQEREWLLNLGQGNIIEGVRNLIQQAKDKQELRRNDYYVRGRGGKKWGRS
jgi:hypothetical protein